MLHLYPLVEDQTAGHTYLASVAGLSFYEHGTYGDEYGLVLKWDGKFYSTDFYDMPDFQEAEDLKNSIKMDQAKQEVTS